MERQGTARRARKRAHLLGHGLDGNGGLLVHGRDDRDEEVLARGKLLLDFLANVPLGQAEVVLRLAGLRHQVHEALVNVDKLVVLARHVGDIHVVRRGRHLLVLLAVENVDADEVDLGVAVLARLGRAHLDNLAGAPLDDHVTVLAQRRALHRVRERGSRVRILKVALFHFDGSETRTTTQQRGAIARSRAHVLCVD
eukprot:Opistho-1_new@43694